MNDYAIIAPNGADTVVIAGSTYTGTPRNPEDIQDALDSCYTYDGGVRAANVSLPSFKVELGEILLIKVWPESFAGENITMSQNKKDVIPDPDEEEEPEDNHGGAIFLDAGGVIIGEGGELIPSVSVYNSNFSDNSAKKGGGAIYVRPTYSQLSVDYSTFSYNESSEGNGGAIYVSAKEEDDRMVGVGVRNSVFVGNKAINGGAIYVASYLYLPGGTFSGNEATNHGGAIYSTSDCLIITDSVFATASDSIYSTGVLILGGTIRTAAQIFSDKKIHFDGSSGDTDFVLDISGYTGGDMKALLANYDTAFANDANFSISVNVAQQKAGNYILADTASSFNKSITLRCGSETSKEFKLGESLFFLKKEYSLALDKSNNVVLSVGASSVAIVTMKGVATDLTIGTTSYHGKAYSADHIRDAIADAGTVVAQDVALEGFTITLDVDFIGDIVTMSGNTTTDDGGAIYTSSAAGRVMVTGSTFTGNIASGNGGAVYSISATTITNSVFDGNAAVWRGGAIFAESNLMTVTGSTFTGNEATNDGGAIFNSGTTTITEGVFTGNTTSTFGGAIYTSAAGRVMVTGSTFTGNEAVYQGGAIYNSGAATITEGVFTGNTAAFGGAIFAESNLMMVTGSTFTGNIASRNGGAVYNESGTVSISGSTFTGNEATNDGGAIYNAKIMTIRDSVFATASDTIYNNDGALTLGGTIRTAANITSNNKIAVENDTQLVLDISGYTVGNTTAFLSNYDTAFSNDANLSITVILAENQTNSDYILVDTASTFNKSITLICGSETSDAFGLGETVTFKGSKYSLVRDANDNVWLKNFGDVAIVTTAGTATVLTIGTTTYRGRAYSADKISTAVADNKITAAQDVTLTGFTVTVGKEFVGDVVAISGNTSTANGGAIFTRGTVSIQEGTLADNKAAYGGVIYNSGTLTLCESEFTSNNASRGGAVYNNNSGTATIEDSVFSGNTASTFGGAIYNSGTATIRNSVFATVSDTVYNQNGVLTFGGTIWTAANITSNNKVAFEDDTLLMLDISVYAAGNTTAFFSNYNTAFDDAECFITVNVAAYQAEGDYILADTASNFDKSITLVYKDETSSAFGLEEAVVFRGREYALARDNDNNVVLTVGGSVAIVTTAGTATELTIGTTTYRGSAYSADNIGAAVADARIIAAQDVTLSGFTVSDGKVFLGDNITMADTASAIYSDGMMTLSGKITTGANITSTRAVTVEKDTALVLDLSGYAGTTTKELLTDFNTMFGTTQDNLSITVNVAQTQEEGVYTLATSASLFDKTVSVASGQTEIGSFDLQSGSSVIYLKGKKYTLALAGGTLSFAVSLWDTAVVTKNGDIDTVVISGVTYSGEKYNENEIAQALADYTVVATQDVTLAGFTISEAKQFVGDAVVMSGNEGGAIYNSGTATILNSIFATASDTVYNQNGVLTFGGTIRTAAKITSDNKIAFKNNTQLVLDISGYTVGNTTAFLANYDTAFSNDANFSITVNIAASQADADYVLADTASTFNKSITLLCGSETSDAFKIGESITFRGHNYSLALDHNNNVVLSVGNVAIVTTAGTATELTIGTTTYQGRAYSADQISTAIAERPIIAAQNVTLTGFTVTKGREFIGDQIEMSGNTEIFGGAILNGFGTATIFASTFTDNTAISGGAISTNDGALTIESSVFDGNTAEVHGGAIYGDSDLQISISGSTFTNNTAKDLGGAICAYRSRNTFITGSVFSGNSATTKGGAVFTESGKVTIRDSVFATASDTIVSEGGTLTLGGTIRTAANIASTKAITVENDTQLVLDISGYTVGNTTAFLSNYDTAFSNDANLSITVNIAVNQSNTDYILADRASSFNKSITLVCGNETSDAFGIGESVVFKGGKYSLVRDTNNNVLLKNYGDVAIVTSAGTVTTLVIGTKTYYGEAYSSARILDAVAEKSTIAAQEVTLTGFTLTEGKKFVGDTITMSGNTAAGNYGGAIDSQNGMVAITGGIFTDNTAIIGGVIYNSDGVATIENSVFTGNTANAAGAIFSAFHSQLSISGSTFTNNTAKGNEHSHSGAIYVSGTATISDSVFSDNSSYKGGAIYVSGTATSCTITGSTFTGNTATDNGGAIRNSGTATIENSVFATASDTVYNMDGTLTLGGTIRTAANITSTNAITVEEDTELILDLSVRTASMGEMLTDYDTAFGSSQNNLSISVNASQTQSAGVYTLATNASSFNRSIALCVENNLVTPLDPAYKYVFGERMYRLCQNSNGLQLTVEDVSNGKIFGTGRISQDSAVNEAPIVKVLGCGSYIAAAAGVFVAADAKVSVNAETQISIDDGSFASIVCAGSIVNQNTILTVNADSALTIFGGTFANAVAGGNYIQYAGGTVTGGRGEKAYDTYVNISGGTFLRDIFGGNISAKNEFSTKTSSYVTGSTNITIDTRENAVFIGGNVVAGSSGLGQVINSTNLTFKGLGSNLSFGNKSIVCGDGHDATTSEKLVGEDRILTFDNFTGTLDAKLAGFDKMDFIASNVTLTKSSRLSDIEEWNFAANACVTLDNVSNNFSGDKLNFGEFDGDEWTVVSGSESTLANWDWANQVTIAGQNASFNESLSCWTSDDYKFYKEDNALKVAKLA